MALKDTWTRLEDPTSELVKKYLRKYQDNKHYSNEDEIQKIITNGIYDKHKYETILLTVVVINELYSTSIYKVYSIADHIYNNRDEIHRLIDDGDSKAIAGIATGHDIISSKNKKELNFYSFASKYCNYLNPEEFPIYDSYIENMLCFYNKKEPFAKFKRGDLRDYDTFRDVILKFREHFMLNEFKLRDIDKFLWLYGKDLFKL